MSNIKYDTSIASGEKLQNLFSLGEIHISDFLKEGEVPKYDPCKLELAFDPESKLVQLTEQPPNEAMWGSFYWYRSQTNPVMIDALKNVADSTISKIAPSNRKETYIDIASNDGTLLSHLDSSKFFRVGIDPSDYPEALTKCDLVIKDFFSKETCKKHDLKARYISCCAMFYDLNKPMDFLFDVYDTLEDDGIFTLQLSYTPVMILQTEFGNICHEHLCYYNLTSLKYLFDKTGFVIKDVEVNTVNGGSIRVYLQKDVAPKNFSSLADIDCAKIRINSLLEWEENNGFNSPKVYLDFYQKILELKEKTLNFIQNEKAKGKSVWGYGASTKAQTLYQFFGLSPDLITKVAEKQECKWGLRMVGSNVPICSEEEMRKTHPDYLLIGPWFFVDNFIKRENEYLKKGGKFILPALLFNIITK